MAKRLARATTKSEASLGVRDPELQSLIAQSAESGIAVLVETPAHARELARSLPGWAVWTACEFTHAKPEAGCGVIATELAAGSSALSVGVLARATGTEWPLPDLGWPHPGDVAHGVLVDFRDEYHPVARENAAERIESYQRAGWAVHEVDATGHKQNTQEPRVRTTRSLGAGRECRGP